MNRLYYLRKQKGMTQSQLGDILNISQQTVSRIEKIRGSEIPSDLLLKMSDYYQFSVDYLIASDEDEDKLPDSSKEINRLYRRLNAYNQETLLLLGRRMLTEQKKATQNKMNLNSN